MKTNSPKTFQIAAAAFAAALLTGFPGAPFVQAATIDWNGANTTWSLGTNWTGGAAPADDLVTDIARFNLIDYTGKAPNSGMRSINGLIFGDGATTTGPVTLTTGTLSLGSGGIVMNSMAGAVVISSGTVRLGANQTWTNNSTNTLTVGSRITNIGNTSPFTLTLSGAGNIAFTGIIQDGGATGTTAIEVNKTSGVVSFSNTSRTFSGGLAIKSGTVSIADASSILGTGTITLGNSSGSANATLTNTSGVTIGNAINNAIYVAAGSTGELRIGGSAGWTFGGAVTLNNNLHIGGSGGVVIFNGGVTGTGNLIVDGGAAFNANTGIINMNGTITVTGAQAMTLNGGVGSNVTAITAGASAGDVIIKGLAVNSGGTTITTLSQSKKAEITAGTTGTGDLTFISSNNVNATIFSGAGKLDHHGALIISGTGTGNREFTAGIGSNVTEIVLSGSGALLMRATPLEVNANGTTLINNGAKAMGLYGTVSAISGTGDLILKNNGSMADGLYIGSAGQLSVANNVGRIINSGTGSGSVIIRYEIGSNVTGVEQDSATSMLTLSGSNTFTAQTVVKSGTLTVANANALQFSTLNTGTAAGSQVVINQSSNIGGLAGSRDINVGSNGHTLTIGGNNENTVYSGSLIGTNLSIVKTGTGTLAFTGSNNFGTVGGNGTTINAGALMINNGLGGGVSGAGGGNITVNSGATFGGTGYVKPGTGKKITVASGAYLSAGDRTGNAPGALILDGAGTTANLLTMATGSKFSFRVGGDGHDEINFWNFALSDLVLNNNVIEITLLDSLNKIELGTSYTLFRFYTGNGSGLASSGFEEGALSLSFVNDLGYPVAGYLEYNLGKIDLIFTSIPEPSTWALFAGSLAMLAIMKRRRAKLNA